MAYDVGDTLVYRSPTGTLRRVLVTSKELHDSKPIFIGVPLTPRGFVRKRHPRSRVVRWWGYDADIIQVIPQ